MRFDNTRFEFDPTRLALSPAEAAEALGVSRAHLYRLIAKGAVPARKLGRRLAIPTVGLMHLLDPHRGSGGSGERAVPRDGLACEPTVPASP